MKLGVQNTEHTETYRIISNPSIHRKPARKGGISKLKRGERGKGGEKVGWKKKLDLPSPGGGRN
jgi:hypothetical protein